MSSVSEAFQVTTRYRVCLERDLKKEKKKSDLKCSDCFKVIADRSIAEEPIFKHTSQNHTYVHVTCLENQVRRLAFKLQVEIRKVSLKKHMLTDQLQRSLSLSRRVVNAAISGSFSQQEPDTLVTEDTVLSQVEDMLLPEVEKHLKQSEVKDETESKEILALKRLLEIDDQLMVISKVNKDEIAKEIHQLKQEMKIAIDEIPERSEEAEKPTTVEQLKSHIQKIETLTSLLMKEVLNEEKLDLLRKFPSLEDYSMPPNDEACLIV